MGKLIGVVFVLLGCTGLVLNWNGRQKRRQAVADELIRFLAGWEYSLERERMRLTEYLACFEGSQDAVGLLVRELAEALDTRAYKSGVQLWAQVLEHNASRLDLGTELWELFLTADRAFFGTSSRESLRCARVCREHMEECLKREKAEHARRLKLYAPLGLLGGVAVIILLI